MSPPAKRPRGLWRAKSQADARRAAQATSPFRNPRAVNPSTTSQAKAGPSQPSVPVGSNEKPLPNEMDDESSESSSSVDESSSEEDGIHSMATGPSSQWTHRTRMLVTDSIASRPESLSVAAGHAVGMDDWEDLKQLFLRAHEYYDADEFDDALPMLRAVIHECHRFFLALYDPSVLFNPHDGEIDDPVSGWKANGNDPMSKTKVMEVPTAFHTLLGTSLLLFGIIIAQRPLLVLPDEVTPPVPYWLAALSAFETADSLPARTRLKSPFDFPHDWRLAVMWGRTLIFLSEELLSRSRQQEKHDQDMKDASTPATSFLPSYEESEQFKLDHPRWPEDSIFHIIETRHPHKSSLSDPTFLLPSELIQQALDHFVRGILHMPHQGRNSSERKHNHHHHLSRGSRAVPLHQFSFSRMRELYNIAASVLIVAEKLDSPFARKTWATQADAIFGQMKAEMLKTSTLLGPGDVEKMRGRCWLVIGSAEAEVIESELEREDVAVDDDVRDTWHAESARVGLGKAVELLTKSMGLILEASADKRVGDASSEPLGEAVNELEVASLKEASSLLTEALLSLANLTKDEDNREALYLKAKEVYGSDLLFDDEDSDDAMKTSTSA